MLFLRQYNIQADFNGLIIITFHLLSAQFVFNIKWDYIIYFMPWLAICSVLRINIVQCDYLQKDAMCRNALSLRPIVDYLVDNRVAG